MECVLSIPSTQHYFLESSLDACFSARILSFFFCAFSFSVLFSIPSILLFLYHIMTVSEFLSLSLCQILCSLRNRASPYSDLYLQVPICHSENFVKLMIILGTLRVFVLEVLMKWLNDLEEKEFFIDAEIWEDFLKRHGVYNQTMKEE